VLLPALEQMGVNAKIEVQKYGYYPKGGGEVTMTVKPNHLPKAISLEDFGMVDSIKGVSVCTFLADRQVAERQANAAQDFLMQDGYNSAVQVVNDASNPYQKGSSIALWAETSSGMIIGADAIGELRKTSEAVGEEAAKKLIAELAVQPTVDVYLADMLIPYMALAHGKSAFFVRTISEHIESNIWLMEKMLNVKFTTQKINKLYRIEKS
jgi:RNA 3'-terminal phosphate cyclase (ATP)